MPDKINICHLVSGIWHLFYNATKIKNPADILSGILLSYTYKFIISKKL